MKIQPAKLLLPILLTFMIVFSTTTASGDFSTEGFSGPEIEANESEAPVCPPGMIAKDLVYEGFESAPTGWTFSSLDSIYGTVDTWQRLYGVGSAGNYALHGMDYQGNDANPALPGLEVAASTNSIPLPPGDPIYLRFEHLYGFEAPNYDGGLIQYSAEGGPWIDLSPFQAGGAGYNGTLFLGFGNPNGGEGAFVGESGGYLSSRYDLTALSGQNVVFRWMISADNDFYHLGWMLDEVRVYACDKATWADFDGDGDTDVSIYRSSNGRWYFHGGSYLAYGIAGDRPVPGDYDGDGDYDVVIYRPSIGKWYLNGIGDFTYGIAGDIPMQCDYDGDGTTDIAIYRPSNGRWYIKDQGYIAYGIAGDIPVPADYDGDGDCDVAVYRPSNGRWYPYGMIYTAWGIPGDIPVPGDYDGDGDADIAIYRPSNGRWYVFGQGYTAYGIPGDIPVPGDYDGDGEFEPAIYRPSNGRWYPYGSTYTAYGITGDYPIPARDTNLDGDPHE